MGNYKKNKHHNMVLGDFCLKKAPHSGCNYEKKKRITVKCIWQKKKTEKTAI